jgi:hypothetical protein
LRAEIDEVVVRTVLAAEPGFRAAAAAAAGASGYDERQCFAGRNR